MFLKVILKTFFWVKPYIKPIEGIFLLKIDAPTPVYKYHNFKRYPLNTFMLEVPFFFSFFFSGAFCVYDDDDKEKDKE